MGTIPPGGAAPGTGSTYEPVVDFDEYVIEEALTALREQGLTRIVYSTSNRAALIRSMNLIHGWASGRLMPIPSKPSITSAGRP